MKHAKVAILATLVVAVSQPATVLGQKDTTFVHQVELELKTDLRNFATAQEVHFADYITYTANVTVLEELPTLGPEVTVVVLFASERGWNGVIVDSRVPGLRCGIWMGEQVGPPLGDGAREGEVSCRRS